MLSALLGALRIPHQRGATTTTTSSATTTTTTTASLQTAPLDLTSHKLLGPLEEYSAAKQEFLGSQGSSGGAYGYGQLQAQPSCSAATGRSSKQQQQQEAGLGALHLLDSLRAEQLTRLHGQAYLDHAGAALYTESQIGDAFSELKTQLLTNPHSAHGAGSSAAEAEAELRRLTLEMLHAPTQDYKVILTAGATAAIKLVGDCFPWCPGSTFTYTLHNHNSVLGVRELALAAGASVHVVDLEPAASDTPPPSSLASAGQPSLPQPQQQLGPYRVKPCCSMRRPSQHPGGVGLVQTDASIQGPGSTASQQLPGAAGPESGDGGTGIGGYHLLALPSECNFTGLRYDLDAAAAAQAQGLRHARSAGSGDDGAGGLPRGGLPRGGPLGDAGRGRCFVLLDAAKGCATTPPDLRQHPVDFVALSYYKIFGYPTGLGALVVRKDALQLLNKTYFAGGTVLVSVADQDFHERRAGHAGLEYGTLPFTSIAAARHGFRYIQLLGGFPAISRHAGCLAGFLAQRLAELRHYNGRPVAELYGWSGATGPGMQGPTVTFNLRRPDGGYVGYGEVRQLASLHGLHLRYGCFCNPGACAKMLHLTGQDLRENFLAGHVCWDDRDLVDGRPTGAVRASLGALSTFEEVYLLLRLVAHYWVQGAEGLGGPAVQAGELGRGCAAGVPEEGKGPDIPVSAAAASAGSTACRSDSLLVDTPSSSGGSGSGSSDGGDGPARASCGLATATGTPAAPGAACKQTAGTLTSLFLYPVKSCAAQQVMAWPVGPTGLLYDREWALLDASGRVLTQKQCPRMATVTPSVDLRSGTLALTSPGCRSRLLVQLDGSSCGVIDAPHGAGAGAEDGEAAGEGRRPRVEGIQVCGERVCGEVLGEDQVEVSVVGACGGAGGEGAGHGGGDGTAAERVQRWFLEAVGMRCRLVRQVEGSRVVKRTDGARAGGAVRGAAAEGAEQGQAAAARPVGFANDGQYLLVNAASVADLNARLEASGSGGGGLLTPRLREAQSRSFRPNLLVEGFVAYAEDRWIEIQIGPVTLDALGTCPRCEMLQVDQDRGTRGGADILLELAQYRRRGGKMHFGMLLAASSTPPPLPSTPRPSAEEAAEEAAASTSLGDTPVDSCADPGPDHRLSQLRGNSIRRGPVTVSQAGDDSASSWMVANFAAVLAVGMPIQVLKQS